MLILKAYILLHNNEDLSFFSKRDEFKNEY